jgi:hypothetical protein
MVIRAYPTSCSDIDGLKAQRDPDSQSRFVKLTGLLLLRQNLRLKPPPLSLPKRRRLTLGFEWHEELM